MSALAATAERQSVYLHPGQIHASADPCSITTVLGSCVSVCIYDRTSGIGGANHYLLPQDTRGDDASPRYGPAAIRALVARVVRLGGAPGALEAKIFGGASMLMGSGASKLGLANVEIARLVLREHRIPIVAEDTGGSRGRKLLFDLANGSAWVKII